VYPRAMPPWTAERTVDAALARALIRGQFPALEGEPTPLGQGWDNSAFLVGDVVFRFPRRQLAVTLLERESRHLPALQELPLRVPNPIYLGRPSEPYPWPFSGYHRLPGRSACSLDDAQRRAVAAPLGAFLRALHARPAGDAAPDELGRLDIAKKAGQARAELPDLDPILAGHLEVPPPSPGRPQVLVHGDLYARHLLVDGDRLSAVIDWGDVHRNDPAIDLSVAWSFLPPEARADFRAAYGDIDDETWRLARFRATTHSILTATYAAAIGDAELAAEGARALDHLRAM
jgi:aminoglycoside phosphotransferase (APT) family kinase protein